MSDGADTSAAAIETPVAVTPAVPETSTPLSATDSPAPAIEMDSDPDPIPAPVPPPIVDPEVEDVVQESVSQPAAPVSSEASRGGQAPQAALSQSAQPREQSQQPVRVDIKNYLGAALEKIRFRKRAKLDKIVILAKQKGTIKNDDVEKALRISDSTATRYLNQLVLEGRLGRSGPQKHAIYSAF